LQWGWFAPYAEYIGIQESPKKEQGTMNTATTQTLPKKVETLLRKLNRDGIAHEMVIDYNNDHCTIFTIKTPENFRDQHMVISTFVHTVAHTTEGGRQIATSTKHSTYFTGGERNNKETRNEHQAIKMWAIWSRSVKAGA
jgi:hypothetical protein